MSTRTVHHWNPCAHMMVETSLVMQKVLYCADITHTEIIFSTPVLEDTYLLGDCSNLILMGKTEQVLYNVQLVDEIVYQQGQYLFTVSCELGV